MAYGNTERIWTLEEYIQRYDELEAKNNQLTTRIKELEQQKGNLQADMSLILYSTQRPEGLQELLLRYFALEDKYKSLSEVFYPNEKEENKWLKEELEKHRWIPVSEKLPRGIGDYFVSNGIWIERIWFKNEWCWQNGTPYPHRDGITHWKPILLPEQVLKEGD